MKNFLLLAALVSISTAVLSQSSELIRDAHAQDRHLSGFKSIEVASGVDLYLSQGSDAVAVSASKDEYVDKIQTIVENGVLKIFLKSPISYTWGFHQPQWKAYVSVGTLERLQASGGSDIYIKGALRGQKLNVVLSGGSDLKGGTLNFDQVSFVQTGGSDVSISGKVGTLEVQASGGGDFKGYDLISETCNVHCSGGSDAQVNVNKELNVQASGGSDVYYKGQAVIRELKSSGGSSVEKRS